MGIDLKKYSQPENSNKTFTGNRSSTLKEFLKKDIPLGKTLNEKKKMSFYHELSALLKAGLDTPSSLEVIVSNQKKKKQKEIFLKIYNDLIAGKQLSISLQETKIFTDYEYLSVEIGEETGNLIYVLKQLEYYFKEKNKIKSLLSKALSYPLSVLFMALLVVIFMLNFVLPQYLDMYKNMNVELPSITQTLIDISNFISNYGLYILLIMLLMSSYLYFNRQKLWFKKGVAWILLKIPFWGTILKKIYLTRSFQLMDLLMSSKAPLNYSLDVVSKAIPFYPIQNAYDGINNHVKEGKNISEAMRDYPIFDTRATSLMRVGEMSNELSTMFHNLAENYKDEVETSINLMQTALQQVLLYIVGGIVLVILIAMYLPMLKITDFL